MTIETEDDRTLTPQETVDLAINATCLQIAIFNQAATAATKGLEALLNDRREEFYLAEYTIGVLNGMSRSLRKIWERSMGQGGDCRRVIAWGWKGSAGTPAEDAEPAPEEPIGGWGGK